MGAWLYQGNCSRCHGSYGDDRFAKGLATKELKDKIAGTKRSNCTVKWALAKGGPLASKQIDAVVAYLAAWESAGAAPELPPLPPYPTATAQPTPAATPGTTPTPTALAVAAISSLDPALQEAIAQDPIYAGAYVYSQYCYRCHFNYDRARMGSTLPMDVVQKTITNGKAATSMPAFGFTNGGPLKRRDIESVVAYIAAWEAADAPPQLPDVLAAEIQRIAPPVSAAISSPASLSALTSAPASGAASGSAAQQLSGDASTKRATAWLWLHNAFALSLYCLLGAPVLFVLTVGLLLASQIGYRGNREPPGGGYP
jgi:mono/diheme cytochrome c family protein